MCYVEERFDLFCLLSNVKIRAMSNFWSLEQTELSAFCGGSVISLKKFKSRPNYVLSLQRGSCIRLGIVLGDLKNYFQFSYFVIILF